MLLSSCTILAPCLKQACLITIIHIKTESDLKFFYGYSLLFSIKVKNKIREKKLPVIFKQNIQNTPGFNSFKVIMFIIIVI
jgi:hypothetical protein